jgi:hypothetical protein
VSVARDLQGNKSRSRARDILQKKLAQLARYGGEVSCKPLRNTGRGPEKNDDKVATDQRITEHDRATALA